MTTAQTGERNPNWKGGRVVDPRGYVLIRVGVGHPLADVRGYAYEHRLMSAQMLGGELPEGIIVHHEDEDKSNNESNNLIPCLGQAQHRFLHRRSGSKLRSPGEDNPKICCACGCGDSFQKYDENGRPRHFVSGHNRHPSITQDAVVGAVLGGAITVSDVSSVVLASRGSVRTALAKAAEAGRITRTGIGHYGPPGSQPRKQQSVVLCECGCGEEFNKYDSGGRRRRFVSGHNARIQ